MAGARKGGRKAGERWQPTQPKPIPDILQQPDRYSPAERKRQVDRLQGYDRRDMRPKTRAALESFEQTGDSEDLVYRSTYPGNTSNPSRPRTVAAGYDSKTHTLRFEFRKNETSKGERGGAVYEYYRVPPQVWRNVRRTGSEGKNIINKQLDGYPYKRIR